MPSKWAMVDGSFPTFQGSERPQEQIEQLVNYMYILVEELKYQLKNLDADNWNESALEELQVETTADVQKQLLSITASLTRLTNEVASVVNRLAGVENLSGRVQQVEEDVDRLETWKAEIDEEIREIRESVETAWAELTGLGTAITPDGLGGATIGREGQELHLVGKVYINGTLYEEATE